METLIVYTKINLIDKLHSILSDKKDWRLIQDNGLSIFNQNGKYIRLELINPEYIFDETIQSSELSMHQTYAFHYRNLEMVKFIIECIDDHNAWINNDFESKNYSYDEFINKMHSNKYWDWRIANL